MRLNNGGWGYREMIIYSCIILFALIFVAASISSFYADMKKDVNSNNNNNSAIDDTINDEDLFSQELVIDKSYYALQENRLKNATLDYVNKYAYELSEDILVVSIETLVSFGFIEPIYDQTGSYMCSGYSNVYVEGSNYGIVPYISCNNYVTIGY